MQSRIFGPLGMNNTFSTPGAAKRNSLPIARSYTDEDGAPEVYDSDPLDNLNGSGSTYSTLGDLFLYDQALYTDRLVQQSTLAIALKPGELNNGQATDYGFAWEITLPVVGHSGAWLGFTSCH